jgi:hypothetical protein
MTSSLDASGKDINSFQSQRTTFNRIIFLQRQTNPFHLDDSTGKIKIMHNSKTELPLETVFTQNVLPFSTTSGSLFKTLQCEESGGLDTQYYTFEEKVLYLHRHALALGVPKKKDNNSVRLEGKQSRW